MRKTLLIALGALTLSLSMASPAMADPVSECFDKVTKDCDAALKESNWIEKVAVGFICTLMYIACGGVTINIKAS
jgi:hypothetical protein